MYFGEKLFKESIYGEHNNKEVKESPERVATRESQ
jgi:hypothetical protein